jgi:hypothetical protein
MSREQILSIINNSGLASQMGALRRALMLGAAKTLLGEDRTPRTRQEEDILLLNGLHPAVAGMVVDHLVKDGRAKGHFKDVQFTTNAVANVKLMQNADMDGQNNFSTVLRQFLLPRYAYLDFDTVVDPRHQIDFECGYPKFITPIMYRYMYDRDDVSRRVVDIFPDESWAANPTISDTEDKQNKITPFTQSWMDLCDDYLMIQNLYRIDRLSGVGHYGVLLMGIDDGKNLEEPIDEKELLDGSRNSIAKKRRNLLYLRPFDEYLSFVVQYETDQNHPRYGQPVMYNLVFLDMTIDAAGASIGTRLNRRVHWTRVIHIADNLASSLTFGMPRMQAVFNRLLDLRKIKGGSAEMFWKGAFPGIMFEVDPQVVADDPDFDEDKFREEVANYMNGMQKSMTLLGIKANSLAPNICEHPEAHVKVQVEAISSHFGIPYRIWMGSEEARLASSQDKLTWNSRLGRRCRMHTEPYVIRAPIRRFVAVGVMPAPANNKFFVGWGDLNASTDDDKANLALKWTQALSQYVATGIIHFIGPMDYLTLFLGIRPSDAKRIIEWVEENGGWSKLEAVDPSQGAGINGKRENQVGFDKPKEKAPARQTADKKTEGSSS